MATSTSTKKKAVVYIWEGKDKKGAVKKGSITAANEQLIRSYLQKQGIVPTKVAPKPKPVFGEQKGSVSTKNIVSFTRQMSTMLRAGMPVTKGLSLIAEGVSKPLAYKEMIEDLKLEIEGGSSFSGALAKYPLLFDDLYRSLVTAGEEAGVLESTMGKIATNMEKSETTKKKIKKALTYPIIVLIVACIVTAILLLKVIPVFEGFFSDFGAKLPALTLMVVGFSHALATWGWLILLIIVALIFSFLYFKKRNLNFRRRVNRFAFKTPIIGTILRLGANARFSRTLGVLFDAGVPLVKGLKATGPATGSVIYEEAVESISADVENGSQLNFAMLQTGRFDPFAIQMVAIGEESGKLGEMLGNVANFYEEELDYAVDKLTAMIEPFIMAFLAIVVGTLVISMYLPIFGMADIVK